MNFTDTMASVELVLAANQVPLLVGETGIGKTSLAARVAEFMIGNSSPLMVIF